MKRKDKYYHHIENVREDEDFWLDYRGLIKAMGRPEFFHPAISPKEHLDRFGYTEAKAVFQAFLDKWGIDDKTLREVINPRKRWEVHPSEVNFSLDDQAGEGLMMLQFQEDVTQPEFFAMREAVQAEQTKREIKRHKPNSTSFKSARAAYLARKLKKENPKRKWQEVAWSVNDQLDTEYDHNSIAKLYRKFYRSTEDRSV